MRTAYVVVREHGDWSEPIEVCLSIDAANARLTRAVDSSVEHDDWKRRYGQEIDRRLAGGLKRGLIFPGPLLHAELIELLGPEPPAKEELAVYPVPMETATMATPDCCSHDHELDIDPHAAVELGIATRKWAFATCVALLPKPVPITDLLIEADALARWLLMGEILEVDEDEDEPAAVVARPLRPGEPGDWEH